MQIVFAKNGEPKIRLTKKELAAMELTVLLARRIAQNVVAEQGDIATNTAEMVAALLETLKE